MITKGNHIVEIERTENSRKIERMLKFHTQKYDETSFGEMYVTVISEGFRNGKEKSQILINNVDFSLNKRGINIAIIDEENGKIIDCINIDTWKNATFDIVRI